MEVLLLVLLAVVLLDLAALAFGADSRRDAPDSWSSTAVRQI